MSPNDAIVAGQSLAISRRATSPKIMYAGTPRPAANSWRISRSRSNSISSHSNLAGSLAARPAFSTLRLGHDGARQLQRLFAAQPIASFLRQFHDAHAAGCEPRVAKPHQLATDCLPLVAAKFIANAVGGNLVVPPLADGLRVRAGEDFHDVVQPETETGLLHECGYRQARNFCAASVPSNVSFGSRQLSHAPQFLSVKASLK